MNCDKLNLSLRQQIQLDLIDKASQSGAAFKREENPMIEDRALRTVSRTVADNRNNSIAGPRGPVIIDDFQLLQRSADRVRNPRVTVISGSAIHAEPVTIDVTDYAEIKSHAPTTDRTDTFLSAIAGPLLAFTAAAVVAVTVWILPAPDRPIFAAGPLAGHSLLHFPR